MSNNRMNSDTEFMEVYKDDIMVGYNGKTHHYWVWFTVQLRAVTFPALCTLAYGLALFQCLLHLAKVD